MTYRIRLDPAAFNTGNRFDGQNRAKVNIVVGTNYDEPIIPNTAYGLSYPKGGHSLVITIDGAVMPDNIWGILGNNIKAQLADMITKALIIVEKDGVAQTASAVLP